MELNFRLCDGLPKDFDCSGTAWNNLTWFERKRHKYIRSFRILIGGDFQYFLNYSGILGRWEISYRYDGEAIKEFKFSKVPCPKGTHFFSIRIKGHILLLIRN